MRNSIGKLTIVMVMLAPIVGCKSGMSLPRWDWWRSASKEDAASKSSSLASSATSPKLPSQLAKPKVAMSNSAGSPGSSPTFGSPSIAGAGKKLSGSPYGNIASSTKPTGTTGTAYPSTPYPPYSTGSSRMAPGSSAPGSSAPGSPYPGSTASFARPPSGLTAPAMPGAYKAPSTPMGGMPSVQNGPYNPNLGSTGTFAKSPSSGYLPSKPSTTPGGLNYTNRGPYGSTAPSGPNSFAKAPSSGFTSPLGPPGGPSSGAVTQPRVAANPYAIPGGAPRYDGVSSPNSNFNRPPATSGPVGYQPGKSDWQPGNTGYNPTGVPYKVPQYQVPTTGSTGVAPSAPATAPQTFQPGSVTSYTTTGVNPGATASPVSATLPPNQVPPPGFQGSAPPTFSPAP